MAFSRTISPRGAGAAGESPGARVGDFESARGPRARETRLLLGASATPAKPGIRPSACRCVTAWIRMASVLWLIWVSFPSQGLAATAEPEEASVITKIGDIFDRPSTNAPMDRPFRLEATVTYWDPQWKLLFVQDETGAVAVNSTDQRLGIEVGQKVRLEGLLTAGAATNLARQLPEVALSLLGTGSMPPAVSVTTAELFARKTDARLVEVQGIVRAANPLGRLQLILRRDGRRIAVVVHRHRPSDLEGVVDAQVRVKAVCQQEIDTQGRVVVVTLHAADFSAVSVERRGDADPFNIPLTRVNRLSAHGASGGLAPRARVRGAVVQQSLGESLILDDGTGPVRILIPTRKSYAKNDQVEAIGFPAQTGAERLLEDAMVRMVEQTGAATVTSAQANPNLAVLRTLKEVLDLTRAEARQRHPVQVTGIVTYASAADNGLFMQDENRAIYVTCGMPAIALRPGQRIAVTGVTDPGGVLTMIAATTLKALSESPLPEPVWITHAQGMTGDYDCRRVRVQGVVQSGEQQEDRLLLDLVATDGRYQCTILGATNSAFRAKVLDSVVTVTGVCIVHVNALNEAKGLELAVPREPDVQIDERAPANVFAIPTHSIREALGFLPSKIASRRIKIRGVASLWRRGRELYLQDETGGIRAIIDQTNQVNLGDEVELVGFRTSGEYSPILQNVDFHVVGGGAALRAKPLTAAMILAGTNNHEVVRIEATLLRDVPRSFAPEFLLSDGNVTFTAAMEMSEKPKWFPSWRAGSVLRVTGVCSLKSDESQIVRGFRLLLRSPADVVVWRQAPWLTKERVEGLSRLLGGIALAALGWIALLRRRVNRQTALIRERLERLRHSEAELAEAQRIGMVGSWEYSVPDRALRMSAQARRLLDLEEDPAPCRAGQVLARVHPADREAVRVALRRVLRHVKDVTMDQRVRLRHGAERMTHCRLEARFDEAGRCVRLHGTIQDITERHEAQERLRMLSQAVEQSPAIVMITDPEGRIDYVNQKFVELTGYSYAEVKDQNPRLLKSGETPPEVYRHLWLTIRAGQPWTGEFHNKKKDGQLYWEEVVISPIKDRQGRIVRFLALKEDVTERKQAERLKTQLELQLRQAQKMEALGTLAGGIAHDFNNILGAIVGYSELARMDALAHPEILESLEQVTRASARAKDLVQQILAFSRQSQQERKPVRLLPIIKECLKLLRSTLPATIEIVADFPAESPVVMADPIQIHQVVMNLCTNAAHAMQGKAGRLSVGLELYLVDEVFARQHPKLRPGAYARLVVGDTGHGMNAETIKRIFDPFFTTKAPGEGTGLGLAVVHGIVEDHQGAILVASQPDMGTTFRILFPTHEAREPESEIPRTVIPRGNGEHILFVDDEPALCRVAQRLLQSWGYRVTTYLSASEALAGFAAQPEAFALVITDLSMPGMTGVDLAAKLLRIRADVPVILASGFVGAGTSEMATAVGIREILAKPVAPALWGDVIDRVLHGPSGPRV